MGTANLLRPENIYPILPLHIVTTGRYSGVYDTSWTVATFLTSANWPANNRAYYVPMKIPARFTIARFLIANGNDATGNVDIGLYNAVGTRLLSTGSTARSGTNVVQYIGVTDQSFPPGNYYLALVGSSTTGQYERAQNNYIDSTGVVTENLGATTLPSTMAPTGQGAVAFLFGFSQSDTL